MKINLYEKAKNLKQFALQKSTRAKYIILAGVMGVTGVYSLNKLIKESEEKPENQIGYTNINSVANLKVKDENFVILDIGDSKKEGVKRQDKKIEYCNKKDISLGLIVTPTSMLANDIYDDVELVKGIIAKNKVDLPIYFNIDKVIENNDIDNDTKIKIITMFLDKCSANGMYIGVYGKDTNLVYLKKYCKITEYDAYVVMDKEEIEYDGAYNLYQDEEGIIHSKNNLNLAEIIENKELNTKEKFVSDGAYVVKKSDDIIEIAMMYNISVNALLNYNDMKEENIKEGTVIRIPSSLNNIVPNTGNNSAELETPIRGCDISHFQKSVDWEQIKNNFDFIILKSNEGSLVDGMFEEHSINCALNNIPYGVYCFNARKGIDYTDNNIFEEALTEQAKKCLETIANKNIEYPVYFDLEVESEKEDIRKIYTKEQIGIMFDNWKRIMVDAGYTPGIYCNKSAYDYILSCYDTSDFEIWIASYPEAAKEKNLEDIQAPESNIVTYMGNNYETDIIQISDSAKNTGAPNARGFTDVDYSFKDYSKKSSKTENEYNFDIKEINRNNPIPIIIGTGLSLGAGTITLGYIIKRKKNKRRVKRKG